MSKALATRFHDPRCSLSHATLAGIEAGALPSLQKMLSLAYCLRLTDEEILEWYGIELAAYRRVLQQRAAIQASPTHRIERPDIAETFPFPWPSEPASENTQLFAPVLRGSTLRDGGRFRFARIGINDDSMSDVIPAGSIVRVDTREKRIQVFAWPTLLHRPVYFVWHTHGHTCAWCQQSGRDLLLIFHPASQYPARRFKTPGDATIIGRVVNVWTAHHESPVEFPGARTSGKSPDVTGDW